MSVTECRYRSNERVKSCWPGKLEPSPIHTVSAREPSFLPNSMHSMLCATACERTRTSVAARLPLR